MKRKLHKLKVKVLCLLGLAFDIHSKGKWPSYALSNFYHNSFEFEGVSCRSMEGFIQSLKCSDVNEQIRVCKMRGKRAKEFGQKIKNNPHYDINTRGIYWKGIRIDRNSSDYQHLLCRAYRAMFDQSPKFRGALAATGNKRLYHSIGKPDPKETILTEKELCTILTELRVKLMDNK